MRTRAYSKACLRCFCTRPAERSSDAPSHSQNRVLFTAMHFKRVLRFAHYLSTKNKSKAASCHHVHIQPSTPGQIERGHADRNLFLTQSNIRQHTGDSSGLVHAASATMRSIAAIVLISALFLLGSTRGAQHPPLGASLWLYQHSEIISWTRRSMDHSGR